MGEFKISYRDIDKFFHRRHLLDSISVTLISGTAILLSGENGSGKTTLLRILAGLEKPTRCEINFCNGEMHTRPLSWLTCRRQLQRQVMYLHQQPYMFRGDVTTNLAYAVPRTLPKLLRAKKIRRALDWAQLNELANANAKTLSGGEQQRVALARAWLRRAKVLLLDEPIANMDYESQIRTATLLAQLKNDKVALMISSHSDKIFTDLIDRRIFLDGGKLHNQCSVLADNVMRLSKESVQQSGG